MLGTEAGMIPSRLRTWHQPRAAWFSLLSAVMASACVDGVAVDNPKLAGACQCSPPAPCPTNVCDLQIEVSAKSCSGDVTEVEVMIGDELEPATFAPGVPRRTCATLPRGATRTLRARANTRWQWVEQVACPPAAADDTVGPTVIRVLNCTAATP